MKAIIVGLGSMGRRRARLLQRIDNSIQIIGIDIQDERKKQAEEELGIITRNSIQEACLEFNPDIAFVSTSPLSHAIVIKECLEKDLHVFTELNLVDNGYDENISLAKMKNRTLFLSSTFLYRKEIEYMKEQVDKCDCTLSYLYHAGQYLPDWHPWESYKSFFVGDKRTNGCREFMAIEFPWLIDVFGDIKTVCSICGKDSSLEIDFPDTYQILFEHETGHKGIITIDIVSRKPVRRLEISGENLYLTWDGTPDTLKKYDFVNKSEETVALYESVENREGYSAFIIEDAYKSEIEEFLRVIHAIGTAKYSFAKDKKILSIIKKIEESEAY